MNLFGIIIMALMSMACAAGTPINKSDSERDIEIMKLQDLEKTAREYAKYGEYEKAESFYQNIIERYAQIKNTNSFSYYFLAYNIYFPQGRYGDAKRMLDIAIQMNKERAQAHEESTALLFRSDIDIERGDYKGALDSLRRVALIIDKDPEVKKVIWLYPKHGEISYKTGDYDQALIYFTKCVQMIMSNENYDASTAKAQCNMAKVYIQLQECSRAVELLNTALDFYSHSFADTRDIAIGQILMAQSKERIRDIRGAKQAYTQALAVLESESKSHRDLNRLERGHVWLKYGQFYFRQGDIHHSDIALNHANELFTSTKTTVHPNYGEVLLSEANINVKNDYLSTATLQSEKALYIMDTALVPTHPRISPTLIALSSIYELTGKSDQAAPLKARIETILQKPLGPWKEDFLETAAFYTEQLKKANKTAAAQYLEQLQARQKDKR